ncbi:uncharacterized protein AMSG_07435 [Thecamonas trahens ATCC 50062]|uniref:Proteasome subunit beta n=1 Tax=Thecamonas trahens ATCC 50062 TaxID=461836 RepID=A0A0L0DHC4_THETB|nr:hypothetical protein AMSG_07435 [Thecamonas trahens ATCC 50062]KNC51536.1 hypothetical protein AMSG_07435 [Thecamonas trahens ATCC 50062]|eukprot:XP_013755938.1 hypothetical protein AMSG_07435 [Thecamonas trahens ATCC 50062]
MQRTQQPIVTGTSVLGIKFDGGVMVAADTLGSYGSLARFRDLRRVRQAGEYTLLGGSGDYMDFEAMLEYVDELLLEDTTLDAPPSYTPRELHQYLARIYYNKRSEFDPLWNQLVVGGVRDGDVFLGYVDLQGTHYEDETVATGYGSYIARPLLREAYRDDLTEAEARKVLEDAMRVLFYRDARTINRIQIGVATEAGGIDISEPFELETDWTVGIRKH